MKLKSGFLLIFLVAMAGRAQGPRELKLWYGRPAASSAKDAVYQGYTDDKHWLSALPLGNGSLGAMVFGDVYKERIQLNEESMWSGSLDSLANNPEAAKSLEKVRALLFEGKYREATALINETQICRGMGSATGGAANAPFGSFQTAGDLWLDFQDKSPYTDYYRELSLETAKTLVRYTQGGVRFKRETFVSAPAGVIVMRLSANKASKLSFTCTMNRPGRYKTSAEGRQLIMQGRLSDGRGGDGLKYMARLEVLSKGGKTTVSDTAITVTKATEAVLLLSISTDYVLKYPEYKGRDYEAITREAIKKAKAKPYKTLLAEHVKDYRSYYKRVTFDITPEEGTDVPTDRRVENAKSHPDDPYLTELLFQYGRYLLISSSRPGSLPANLQGIWSNKIQTAWNGDYHTNINLQMNYWPAEATNLSELHQPFFSLLKNLSEPGARTARIQYGKQGWTLHTIANVWGYTAPGEAASWGMHPGGAAWMCQHIAIRYRYTKDKAFLKDNYPTLAGAVRFYLDWLTEDPKTKKLVSGPASSPENTFITKDGVYSQFSMGPSHDQELIWQLFTDFLYLSKELGVSMADAAIDKGLVAQVEAARGRLALPKIGPDGRLMEWPEAFKEAEPGHRHISHLFAVHPGYQINPDDTPELALAAEKTLDYRLANGGGHTGWSAAWIINQYARLRQGEKAEKALYIFMSRSLAPNLFGVHPPFQIDGNFGVVSGITEMLLQSHDGKVFLLPALPENWNKGSVSGLKAEGNITVKMEWSEGKLTQATLASPASQRVSVYYNGTRQAVDLESNKPFQILP